MDERDDLTRDVPAMRRCCLCYGAGQVKEMEVLEQMIVMEREKSAFGNEQDQGAQKIRDFDSAITAKERMLTSLKARLQAYHQLRLRCVCEPAYQHRSNTWCTAIHMRCLHGFASPPFACAAARWVDRYDELLHQVERVEDEKANLLAQSRTAQTNAKQVEVAKKRLHHLEKELKRLRYVRAPFASLAVAVDHADGLALTLSVWPACAALLGVGCGDAEHNEHSSEA